MRHLWVLCATAFSVSAIADPIEIEINEDSYTESQLAIKATSLLHDEVMLVKEQTQVMMVLLNKIDQKVEAMSSGVSQVQAKEIELVIFRVVFHKEPSLKSQIVATAGLGERFEVIDQTSGFYKTKLGWVSRAVCKEIK